MRILIDISHPAHVHFFRNAVDIWRARGHDVMLVSRDKDITRALLAGCGLEAKCLSRMRPGKWNLLGELVVHEARLMREVVRARPDVMLQIGGMFVAHVGWLRRVPRLVFSDTEMARASNRITFPFATAVLTPSCYDGWAPADRHYSYAGYHELAYLHPNRFTPDRSVLAELGVVEGEAYFLVRFVSWGALHDVGESGFSRAAKIAMIEELARHGRVFITSEGKLPPELARHQIAIPPQRVHHALAFAKMLIGESSTMASEAAVLGVPAIFVSTSPRGYTTEQQDVYDIGYTFAHTQEEAALAKMRRLLAEPDLRSVWQRKRQRLLADKIDVTAWMVDLVEQYPGSLQTLCQRPGQPQQGANRCAA